MLAPIGPSPSLPAQVCQRALDARDARFDGLFYVGIVTTGIYCRPTCPSRRADPDHRRFFDTAAAAEHAGFRPCLRCRPEMAPGKTLIDAVSRLASTAAHRIAAGALNGRSVADLAAELGVGERHLRRALRRELGVSPVELAQIHRLLLAKRLLAETALTVTDIAFASGFESLRRFNVAFRERYGMSPTALRRPAAARAARRGAISPAGDLLRLTLAYRPPLAWDVLTAFLQREATPGVEIVEGRRYGRTVRLDGRSGVVFAEDAPVEAQVNVHISPALLPVLMPLLARLRQLFDLDAQPTVVDAHLERGGLGPLVRQRRGVRLPGALDGFEVGLRALLRGAAPSGEASRELAGRVAQALGEPLETGIPGLHLLAPTAEQVAEAGASGLVEIGVPRRSAETIQAFARAVASGALRLDPGSDMAETHRALLEIEGFDEGLATTIVMRALYWPDAFPHSDRALQEAAGAASPRALLAKAEKWRPWRAYAALHLWLQHEEQ
ncbi:MAG TPA: AlkA N-terminal domain-containing protein [Acetobacteraceae bacterium]|nr:AlkA N-terminal domain-containing protein [Acetobacteraceae bacterium]